MPISNKPTRPNDVEQFPKFSFSMTSIKRYILRETVTCVWVCVRARACVRARVCVCVRACTYACVCGDRNINELQISTYVMNIK